MVLAHEDLQQLAALTALASLSLKSVSLPLQPSSSTTSPLTALVKLTHLGVLFMDNSIVQGLTQLTSLALVISNPRLAQLVEALPGMSRLQRLQLQSGDYGYSAEKRDILSASTQLKHLTLLCIVRQADFDVVLAHAPQLTSLSCHAIELEEDRLQAACSWEELRIQRCDSVVDQLARIPLHSLSRLQYGNLKLPSACPHLPVTMFDMDTFTSEHLRQGLLNLGRCPAWQQSGPDVQVKLGIRDQSVQWSPDICRQLFASLSPLVGRRVQLHILADTLSFDSHVVQELGQVMGSSLTHLHLMATRLPRSFWPAVWAHLPGLQVLSLWKVIAAVIDVASFCAAATRPLQLKVSRSMYTELVADAKVKQRCFPPAAQPQVVISAVDS
jgi:hypothetical protein